ncbi:MAG: hypothetical protein R3C60_08805 [Parvularculaceae bacterium]
MAVRVSAIPPSTLSKSGLLACALLMSACATSGKSLKADAANAERVNYKDEIGVFTDPGSPNGAMDPVAAAAYWGTRYDRDPKDLDAAVKYSAALRKISSVEEAVKVMTRAANGAPDNAAVNLEAGKTLVEAGRAFEAVRYLEKSVELAPRDPSALSAYGVALDQIGQHEAARAKYDTAIAYAPNQVMLYNNKGLSFALSGDLEDAKQTLRHAASLRGADARVRQNLALVLAIKGEMREAERLARSDLPPQVADQNIDYFRALMNQPAYWAEATADNVETPKFDDTPALPKASPKPAAPAPTLKEEPKPQPKKPATPVAQKEGAAAPTAASATAPEPTPQMREAAPATEVSAPVPLLKDN